MGLFSKIFTKLGFVDSFSASENMLEPTHSYQIQNVITEGNWHVLTLQKFFGKAYHSPNKRWIVACQDSDGIGRGGCRDAGNGRVVLLDRSINKVVHELTCIARPSEAAVADNGTYLVKDSGFGSTLQGEVVAFDRKGLVRYRRNFSANIFNIGLSNCGKFAAVQTANSSTKDGNLFEVFDIERGRILFSLQPVTGWAEKYTFILNSKSQLHVICVEHSNLGSFKYSASGVFLDKLAFNAARLEKGDCFTKVIVARDLINADATQENASKALIAVDAALVEGVRNSPDWKALAYRVRGECLELLGELPEALKSYENALLLNPKIGVLNRTKTLRKKFIPKDNIGSIGARS